MSTFRTVINIPPGPFKISHHTGIVFMGSCFSEYIGGKMKKLKYPADVNPFGVIYNPLSIEKSLHLILDRKKYTPDDLEHTGDKWFSFDHHSRFTEQNRNDCLEKINRRMAMARENLRSAKFLILTFGTAWVYEDAGTGRVVSNCHKLPADRFKRRLAGTQEITEGMLAVMDRINRFNPDIHYIFTISPVRHWKDGAVGNALSKSILVVSANSLTGSAKNATYFPAWEIAMDDLRDYRYYEEDMIHPNSTMIAYIWERFSDTYFTQETIRINREIEKIMQTQSHRPRFPGSNEHKTFIEQTRKRIRALEKKYSFLDFSAEMQNLSDKSA